QRAVLQRQELRIGPQRAVLGHPAGGGRVRVRLERSAGGAVRPVRALWPVWLGGDGLALEPRPQAAAGAPQRPSFPVMAGRCPLSASASLRRTSGPARGESA